MSKENCTPKDIEASRSGEEGAPGRTCVDPPDQSGVHQVSRPWDELTEIKLTEMVYDKENLQAFLRCAKRYVGPGDAQDVVQNAVIKAMQSRASYNPNKSTLKHWFSTILRCGAIDFLRKRKRRPDVGCHADASDAERESEEPDIDTVLFSLWSHCVVQEALLALKECERQVCIQFYYLGLTIAEIVKDSPGVTPDAISSRITRVRERLRDHPAIRALWAEMKAGERR